MNNLKSKNTQLKGKKLGINVDSLNFRRRNFLKSKEGSVVIIKESKEEKCNVLENGTHIKKHSIKNNVPNYNLSKEKIRNVVDLVKRSSVVSNSNVYHMKNLNNSYNIDKEVINLSEESVSNKKLSLKAYECYKEQFKKDAYIKKSNYGKKPLEHELGSGKFSILDVSDLEKNTLETKGTNVNIYNNGKVVNRNTQYNKIYKEVEIKDYMVVKSLAHKCSEKVSIIIQALKNIGIISNAESIIDIETSELILQELGHKIVKNDCKVKEKELINCLKESKTILQTRPPIVTIMGHVDHGKTTLLDTIRSSYIVNSECGGITQHIGAYQVCLSRDKLITFIDTPGHESFIKMRVRGAKVTDIVVILISADDGIKDQTIEAIDHAKSAAVPIIIAISKVDKINTNEQKIKTDLLKYNLVSDDMGGDTIVIPISSHKKIGLDRLKEAILFQSEMMDLKANFLCPASGVIIEAKLDKRNGVVATFLPKNGVLRLGDVVVVRKNYFKIRRLISDNAKNITKAMPSMPVEVVGLSKIPNLGDSFHVVNSEKVAKELIEIRKKNFLLEDKKNEKVNLSTSFIKNKIFSILIKADVYGSLEAIKFSIEKLNTNDITIKIVYSAVGSVTESDIALAIVTNSKIINFNTKSNNKILKIASDKKIKINKYTVIYDLINDIKSFIFCSMPVIRKEKIIGIIKVLEVFSISKQGRTVGCLVKSGFVTNKSRVRVVSNNIIVYEGYISSLRRFKNDVKDVQSGFECGIHIDKLNNIKKGDILEAYDIIKVDKISMN